MNKSSRRIVLPRMGEGHNRKQPNPDYLGKTDDEIRIIVNEKAKVKDREKRKKRWENIF